MVIERGGFDAIVGNPPFLGAKKLKSALGNDIREWFVEVLAEGERGNADLVAYFIRRAAALLGPCGTLGLIATDTIAQGESLDVGLGWLVRFGGFDLFAAIRSESWPSRSVQLQYAVIWCTHAKLPEQLKRMLDGEMVSAISVQLEPLGRVNRTSYALGENRRTAFVGSYVLGKGFVLSNEEAAQLRRAGEGAVVKPFIIGDDLASRPDLTASRSVIDFFEMSYAESQSFPGALALIDERVRPERQRVDVGGEYVLRKPLPQRWWQYADKRPALYRALTRIDRFIAIPRLSKATQFTFVPTGCVIADSCVAIASDDPAMLAVLSSSMHQGWILAFGTTRSSSVMYSATALYEPFPLPELGRDLASLGTELESARRSVMEQRQLGLTSLYNSVNSPQSHGDPDVDRIRGIQVQIDTATMAAYGWEDISLGHGFHTYRQVERFTVSPAARVEILDRLLELNHERARAEGQDVPDQGALF